jgi:hypothetical protein
MKETTRMKYPERCPGETAAQRREREALSAASARHAAHAETFGASPFVEEPVDPAPVRVKRGELTLGFDTFRGVGYAQVCQLLGLRPSEPHKTRDGKTVRPRRRRRQTSRA